MEKMIEKSSIKITSDLLRIDNRSGNRLKNPQRTNVEMIARMWGSRMVSAFEAESLQIICGDEGGLSSFRAKFLKTHSLPLESDSWAYIFEGDNCFDELKQAVIEIFAGSIVVGYELPPYMKKAFDEGGVKYINMRVCPLRFLNDYMLDLQSNDPKIEKRWKAHEMPNSLAVAHACAEIGRSARIFPREKVLEDSVVFFGQTEIDAALVYDGRLMTISDTHDYLRDLTAEHDRVYFKHHPHSKSIDLQNKWLSKIPRVEVIDANTYALLGHDNVRRVAAISSSVLDEAKYFPIDIISRMIPQNPENYTTVMGDFLHPDFWDVTSGKKSEIAIDQLTPLRAGELFKRTLNMRWGK